MHKDHQIANKITDFLKSGHVAVKELPYHDVAIRHILGAYIKWELDKQSQQLPTPPSGHSPRPTQKQPPWATHIGKFTPRRFRIMRETVPQIKVDGSEYYHYGIYFPLQDTTMYDKGKQRQGKPKEQVEWIDEPPTQGT